MATFGGPRIDGIVAPSSQSKTTVKTGYSGANDPYAAGYTAAKQAFAGGANTQTAGNAALKATLTDPNYSAPLVAKPSGMTSPLAGYTQLADGTMRSDFSGAIYNTNGTPVTGGGGGGGSTPSTTSTPPTPPPPQGPAAPTTTEGPGAASALAGYTEDEISAALAGLEAQFGMTRAQLLADQTQAGAQYRLLLAQLERGRVQGIETATNDAVRRGIYRSGILGENIAEVEGATLDQRRVAEEDLSARTTATENQLRNLNAMQAAQAAQIEAQLRGEYARTLLEAGMSPGSAMSGGAAQPMPMPNQALFGDPGYGGAPVTNTQGVGQVAPNLLATPVATQQGAPQPAPLPVVTNPITTNPAPAYRDPREAALAYEQYIQMLNSGTNRFMPQPGTQYQPGGGYRIS